eukprot:Hpha_TRINITY_DN14237_c0_g2::TRINITY_DN14237_c0_g2_i1::g.22554::m.22554/K00685/ATE1; arginyl-tRNA---protein transferase
MRPESPRILSPRDCGGHQPSRFLPLGRNRGHCSYCDDATFVSDGVWAEGLECGDFQNMLNSGWRRFGQYCWTPVNEQVCCPQYPIRVDTRGFRPSKGQQRVWKRLERYLRLGPREHHSGELRARSRSRSKLRRHDPAARPPSPAPRPEKLVEGSEEALRQLRRFTKKVLEVALCVLHQDAAGAESQEGAEGTSAAPIGSVPDPDVVPSRSEAWGDWSSDVCWRLSGVLRRIRRDQAARICTAAALVVLGHAEVSPVPLTIPSPEPVPLEVQSRVTTGSTAEVTPELRRGRSEARRHPRGRIGLPVVESMSDGRNRRRSAEAKEGAKVKTRVKAKKRAPPKGEEVEEGQKGKGRGLDTVTHWLISEAVEGLRGSIYWPACLRSLQIKFDGHFNLFVTEAARPLKYETRGRHRDMPAQGRGRSSHRGRQSTAELSDGVSESRRSRRSSRSRRRRGEEHVCPFGHHWDRLQSGSLPPGYSTVICDICLSHDLHLRPEGFEHCPQCSLDKCVGCKWEQVPRCPRELSHLMRWICKQRPEGYDRDPVCEGCQTSDLIHSEKGYYHCKICQIDVHREDDKHACSVKNPRCGCGYIMSLLRCQLPGGYDAEKGTTCDVCQKTDLHKEATGYWHCRRCLIDVHRSCEFENRSAHIRNSVHGRTLWTYKGNRRIDVRLVAPVADEETLALFWKYQREVHGEEPEETLGVLRVGGEGQEQMGGGDETPRDRFQTYLVKSPLFYNYGKERAGTYGTFHFQYRLDGVLFMVTVVDILPRCVNSVYCFYDPRYRWFQPGKLSVLFEMEWIRKQCFSTDLRYYYLGMYVHSSTKMRYKADYRPSELKCGKTHIWVPFDDVRSRLDAHSGSGRDKYFPFVTPCSPVPLHPTMDFILSPTPEDSTPEEMEREVCERRLRQAIHPERGPVFVQSKARIMSASLSLSEPPPFERSG